MPEAQAPFSVKKVTRLESNASRESVSEGLFRGISGVQVNDNQGNPYQADVTYRGFSVTPLLGTPPGLSVYVDGVRQNETFGDVVRFDAIPQSALKTVSVLPGTLPQFGLNSLGGAIVMQTKSGRDFQGQQLDVEAGGFGRKRLGYEQGWVDASTQRDFYINLNALDEQGWRVQSPSSVLQLFAKMGVGGADSFSNFTVNVYDTSLNGNGVVPRSQFDQSRSQAYTYFDNTKNTGAQLAFDFTRYLKDGAELSGNVFYRTSRSRTFNGDVNENEDYRFGVAPFEPGNGAGPNYNVTCDAPLAQNSPNAPGAAPTVTTDNCTASNNRGLLNQDALGVGVQLTLAPKGLHTVALGAQVEFGQSDFRRSYTLGVFDSSRTVVELQRPIEQVNVAARNTQLGLYVQDVVALSEQTTVLLAGRYNRATVKTNDRIDIPLVNAAGNASPGLNNDYTYNRFNPSVGISHTLNKATTVYASAGTSNRTPTPVELACSDPNFPCLLPNAMAADPYLKQVVTTTVETGLRRNWKLGGLEYSTAFNLFRAVNKDDILFVTDGAGSGGFFQNFGKTRRQGVELDWGVESSRWDFSAKYQYLDATFQSTGRLASHGNSSAVDSTGQVAVENAFITVNPGNKIPGLSAHNLKLSLGFKSSAKTTVFGDLQAQSRQFARGNENNQHQAGTFTNTATGDTFTFNDTGVIPGFAVFNVGINHTVDKGITVLARLNNVFDRRYFNGGVLGGNVFDRNGQLVTDEADVRYETFLAPATPRNAWVGVQWRY
ncbi:TonB-dependent receptor [Limnobacter humi]|uniref:TonB-dependent receptor n=1 Tax=Limnobacter humi TaxID=1778671 RepID=A0ABT1WGJ5_9BURK|nr:TonB-dependent receptor [Limnobacter humi]MCQ8896642.1 TonB-dependent receptor [Limnobacter humi]